MVSLSGKTPSISRTKLSNFLRPISSTPAQNDHTKLKSEHSGGMSRGHISCKEILYHHGIFNKTHQNRNQNFDIRAKFSSSLGSTQFSLVANKESKLHKVEMALISATGIGSVQCSRLNSNNGFM